MLEKLKGVWKMIVIWFKRGTGFGYKSYPPLSNLIDHDRAVDMEYKTRTLSQEVDYIEEILTSNYDERRRYYDKR